MKKLLKILIILIISIVLLYVIPNMNYFYQKTTTTFNDIPEKYKNYIGLDSLASNPEYKIKVFKSIYNGVSLKVNDSIICIPIYKSIDTTYNKIINISLYKINKLGNVIDSLILKNENIELVSKFLINKKDNYYSSWITNGDTTKKKFKSIENGKIFKDKKDYKKNTEVLEYLCSEDVQDSVTSKSYSKNYFVKENQLYIINSFNNFYTENNYNQNNNLKTKSLDEMATLDYFHKEDWIGYFFPNSSFTISVNGVNIPDRWDGTAYYTLKTINSIKFKIENLMLYEGQDKPVVYDDAFNVYQTDKFLLISNNLKGYENKQFLIKLK